MKIMHKCNNFLPPEISKPLIYFNVTRYNTTSAKPLTILRQNVLLRTTFVLLSKWFETPSHNLSIPHVPMNIILVFFDDDVRFDEYVPFFVFLLNLVLCLMRSNINIGLCNYERPVILFSEFLRLLILSCATFIKSYIFVSPFYN